MKTIIFDGRAFAEEKKEEVKIVVAGLRSRGVVPHLASILIGHDPASTLYVGLKKRAAEGIGAELDPYYLPESTKLADVLLLIDSLNFDETVHGIMVQLPIPGELGKHKDEILGAIDPQKDVDGLKNDSKYLHPTSKAAADILHSAEKELKLEKKGKIAIVGATGMVGAPLVKELKVEGYNVVTADGKTSDLSAIIKDVDIVISATGVPDLIKPEMVKEGIIAIDVGSPKGDFDPEVEEKTAFFTPVPGGVGPVTISCLLENLIDAC